MEAFVQDLRTHLELRDLPAFLTGFAKDEARRGSIELTTVTQRVLPGILRELFAADRVTAPSTLALWRLVRNGWLVLVDNDLIEAINARLEVAWSTVHGATAEVPQKLITFEDVDDRPRAAAKRPGSPLASESALPMRRVVLTSAYAVGGVQLSDALSFKKNLCKRMQERQFLKAVRQYFPSFWAYPNVPLRNFIELDSAPVAFPERHRQFAWSAQVSVLLCTDDEDPVVAFELDFGQRGSDDRRERDQLKNDLFARAGVPLIRIRAESPDTVRAEDFFDLLCAEAKTLDALRPRRLRPRREHEFLVPA